MNKVSIFVLGAFAASLSGRLWASTDPAPAPAPALPQYSVETTSLGTLLANPETKAVLVAHAPGIAENQQISAMQALTLRDLQKLVGQSLRDEQLDAIQADFDKLSKR